MNKTAATLATKLIRTAAQNPKARGELVKKVARLIKMGGPVEATLHDRKAFGEDTADFVAWALMRAERISPQEAQKVLERLRIPFVSGEESRSKIKRGPLQVGETVYPDKNVNTNEMNVAACEKYHLKIGQVEKVESDGVAVRFEDGQLIRFEGGDEPGKTTGLYRGTPASAAPVGKAAIEIVYLSDENAPAPRKTNLEQVRDYVEKGELRGEKRNKSYYTGLALKMSENKEGQLYFTIFSQQRDRFPRAINPSKGKLLYIGALGHRPGGWKAEYAKMVADAASASADDE